MSKKSHIPLLPRTANHSCALPSRLNKKKAASIQTDRCISPFELWVESNNYSTEGFVIDNDSIKTYTLALECVNTFHSQMNKKFDDRHDDNKERPVFKIPDVPNYAPIFFMLLGQAREQPLLYGTEEEDNILDTEKYIAKENVIKDDPEVKQLSVSKILEEDLILEQQDDVESFMNHLRCDDVQTIVHHLRDNDSMICSSNTVISEFPPLCLATSRHDHGSVNEDGTGLGIGRENAEELSVLCAVDAGDIILNEGNSGKVHINEVDLPLELSKNLLEAKSLHNTDQCTITKIIKQHIQEEFVSLFDKHKSKGNGSARLVQSHFQVINIPPQINLLEYAQKKMERQLTDSNDQETSQKRYSLPITSRKSMNISSSSTKKVTNMFRKYSQTNFRSLDAVIGNELLEKGSNPSDDDSVILDDEEFEKINGHVIENSDKKQSRDNSTYNFTMGREKSNPLKLTVRDMSKVNEKMLHTIGLFTERGDVRPGVIDILEEQKRAKAKDVRNKQFRVRRQWDLQVHLTPKDHITSSFATTSSKSFISLSSTDLRSDLMAVKSTAERLLYDK